MGSITDALKKKLGSKGSNIAEVINNYNEKSGSNIADAIANIELGKSAGIDSLDAYGVIGCYETITDEWMENVSYDEQSIWALTLPGMGRIAKINIPDDLTHEPDAIIIPPGVSSIAENVFADFVGDYILIMKEEDSITGAPWGAPEGVEVVWNYDPSNEPALY